MTAETGRRIRRNRWRAPACRVESVKANDQSELEPESCHVNDQTEVLPAPLQEDSFDVVMRGYSRGQVDDYIKRTKRQVEELEARLARAEQEAEEARRDRDRSRGELADANRKLETHEPSYDDLGERLTQILKLAQAEAEERRAAAGEAAQQIRAEADEAAARIHQEVDEKRSGAEAEAEEVRTAAHEESQQVRRAADEAAQQVHAEAEERAQRLVADAEERSAAIEESSKRRVEELEEQHTQLLGQLSSVRDSLQSLLPGRIVAASAAQAETEEATDSDAEAGPDTVAVDAITGEATAADSDAEPADTADAASSEDTDSGVAAEESGEEQTKHTRVIRSW